MPAKSTGSAKKTTAKKAAKKKTTATATKKAAPKSAAKPVTKTTKPAAPKARPAKQPAAAKSSGQRVRVRQTRSGIGRRRDFRQTLEALGIKHHQGEVVVTRNPAIDGMLYKVRHLISVTPEE